MPPPISHHKVNFDGAVDIYRKCGGLDIIIRAHEGQVIGVLAIKVHLVLEACIIEALAAVKAFKSKEMHF
ncbi:Uncharacterized protein TCM_010652 [Theobroma cacao]|uniref:RNase H type-1 domain-containing protein n=1 Tax=Theobroma cacao TaxID=3641 RepID=A0A061EEN9_THECC|nr:Uncharacterized protein TCM_010652 [Theobroma cacao]